MATAFARTTRSLATDGFRGAAVVLAVAVALLVAWTGWFFGARLTRLEISETARVEVGDPPRSIEPVVDGRIFATHLALGREVAAGEVLVELDATPQQLELAESRSRLDAVAPELVKLEEEIKAQRAALEEGSAADVRALEQARAQFHEANAAAEMAHDDAGRLEHLHQGGLIAESDFQHAKSEAERRRAAADALQIAIGRLDGEQKARESERRAQIESLERDATHLEGERSTLRATAERLENEIERRKLRAPVAGRIAEMKPVGPGGTVATGDRLATVVPVGDLKVVAQFRPSDALGRVQAGQVARVRLDGFPWMQYGSVAARVTRVASEVRDGLVRVDLALVPDSRSRIPLQHGLPGVVEIEVERLSPAALTLRAAGQFLTRPVSENPTAPPKPA